MNACRRVRGYIPYRGSNAKILEDLNMEEPIQITLKSTAKLIHKIVYTKTPGDVKALIRAPTWRKEGDLTPVDAPKTSKFKRNTILEGIKLYNSLPSEMRKLKPKQFKNEIKKWRLFEQPKGSHIPTVKAVKKIRTVESKSTNTRR